MFFSLERLFIQFLKKRSNQIKFYFFIFFVFSFTQCRSQTRMAINRHEREDPLTAEDLQKNKEDYCESLGQIWSPKQKICVNFDILCTEKGYSFDYKNQNCRDPESVCKLEKKIWLENSCFEPKEACLKQNRTWIGNTCVFDQASCEAQGSSWIWKDSLCQIRSFQEYCSITSLPEEFVESLKMIEEAVGKKDDCEETAKILSTLESFEIPKNLKKIEIMAHQISWKELKGDSLLIQDNLYWLPTLLNLESLKITNSQLTKMPDLKILKKLKTLDLSQNKISDLNFFIENIVLEDLILKENQIFDLRPLSSLKNLKNLDISKNKVNNLYPLKNLKALESLILTSNPIESTLNQDLSSCPKGPTVADVLDQFCSKINSY